MLPNDETASDGARDEPTTDSVYDFLYHDARRVGSFIAQIDPSGHLTSLKQTEGADSGTGLKFSAHAEANAAVARGGGGFEDQRTAAERESLERTYDPLWTNALSLLDMLDQRRMIHDGVEGARIGQFVKVSGSLTVTDLTLWKGLWSMPAIREVIQDGIASSAAAHVPQGNRSERRKHGALKAPNSQKSTLEHQMDAGLAIIGMLPHTIQARLLAENGTSVWCSLREDGLVVSASDLTLKHGITVSGKWTIVGVLDALAEISQDGMATQEAIDAAKQPQAIGAEPMGELMQALTPAIRGLLGRPAQSHGITPLVVFREVSV